MMGQPATEQRPRSARAQATRDRLLAAAARAFAQKGLAGTKLEDDILDPAGISAGSFYINPRTPQLNGKVARSHRTEKDESYQLLT